MTDSVSGDRLDVLRFRLKNMIQEYGEMKANSDDVLKALDAYVEAVRGDASPDRPPTATMRLASMVANLAADLTLYEQLAKEKFGADTKAGAFRRAVNLASEMVAAAELGGAHQPPVPKCERCGGSGCIVLESALSDMTAPCTCAAGNPKAAGGNLEARRNG